MRDYLPRAIAYIQENGDELERARLGGLLGRERPDPKSVRGLLTRQHDDGGFPYQMVPGRPSSVTATATALQWMADLRLLRSPQAERAVVFLLTVQRPDGAWGESPALVKYDPPPQARPGDETGRLYATAAAAFWVARLMGRPHDGVRRAFDFLRNARQGGGPQDEAVQITALVAALAAMVEGTASELTAAGTEVLQRLSPEAWSADRLADLLGAFYAAGFDSADPLLEWGLRQLQSVQQEGGGWASEHGAERDVDLSLRALGVLLSFGVPSS